MSQSENEIGQALARGYCYPENSAKELDGKLIEAMSKEIEKLWDAKLLDAEKLKLFVWEGNDVLRDHTNGMICVLAESLEEALKLIEEKCSYAMQSFPVNQYKVINKPEAFTCWGCG